jgi:hypothetical protein
MIESKGLIWCLEQEVHRKGQSMMLREELRRRLLDDRGG